MKECWINVYEDGLGYHYRYKKECVRNVATNRKLIYRIHVRLK